MRRAFTLIEILVVLAIISVLAAFLLPTFNKVRRSAQCTATYGTIQTLSAALKSYHDDNAIYPVESSPSAPTTSFFFQLQKMGLNYPYVRPSDIKGDSVLATSTSCLLVKDPWYSTAKTNHIRYFRGPQRSDPAYTKESEFRTALGKFFGNDSTFNLWSFGPNQVDDSSDGFAVARAGDFPNSGGDEGTDPTVLDGIKDDITNWSSSSTSVGKR